MAEPVVVILSRAQLTLRLLEGPGASIHARRQAVVLRTDQGLRQVGRVAFGVTSDQTEVRVSERDGVGSIGRTVAESVVVWVSRSLIWNVAAGHGWPRRNGRGWRIIPLHASCESGAGDCGQ